MPRMTLIATLLGLMPAGLASQAAADSAALGALEWRQMGPATMAGRVTVVAGIPGDPDIVYVGSASGGV